MASVTGNDLKRLEDLIISGQKANETQLSALACVTNEIKTDLKILEKRLTALEIGQAEIKGDIKALDSKLTGDIKALDAKVDGLGKRLENQEFVSRGVLIGLIVAIAGGAAKLFGFIGNP